MSRHGRGMQSQPGVPGASGELAEMAPTASNPCAPDPTAEA